MFNNKAYFIILIASFLITIVSTPLIIPVLRKKKMGQKILEIGPNWHKSKEGTPTMGGVCILLALIISFIVFLSVFFNVLESRQLGMLINIVAYAILNCMIGAIDDIAKIRKAENKGLSAKAKFILQSLVAIAFLFSMHFIGGINTNLNIPFFNVDIELGFAYYILCFFILCGMVNAVNLTDGIDGLASSIVLTVGIFLSAASLFKINNPVLSFFGSVLTATSFGFLIFNFHPAKIFMGDTGSLLYGAVIACSGFLLNSPILVVIYGFVFFLEALSDIFQVVYYKITKGKRLFKMAPLHHHFEKSGFSEKKIVVMFSLVSVVFCLIAWLGMV